MRYFTRDDVRKINQQIINKDQVNAPNLSAVSQKILRETRFTRAEINEAFRQARNQVGNKKDK